jgi:hypothetical protein
MARKRDFETAFTSLCDQVHVPFKVRIPAGYSTFTIDVPKIFGDRHFYFSSLFLTPDFYSIEAAVENLEDPDVMNTPINHEILLKASFLSKPSLYPETFELEKTVIKTQNVPLKINDFFEAHKPESCIHLGCFFDWTDKRFEYVGGSWEKFMKDMASDYYNQPLDPKKHFNALPISARTIYGVNNYLIPTDMSDDNLENIRFRLWLAPNTDALFSTDGHLLSLGFTPDQLGERIYQNKIIIENDHSLMTFSMFEAENPHQIKLTKEVIKHTFKMNLKVNNSVFITYEYPMSITKSASMKNINYFTMLKEAMAQIGEFANFLVDVSYDDTAKKFKFTFPKNPAMSKMTLLVGKDLAERLGYGLVDSITDTNAEGERVDDEIDVTKTETKARALGYDTGMILVTNDSKTSNSMKGISDQLMCTIYPTSTGVYEISLLESCFSPPTMHLPNFYSSKQGDIPVTFKLYRFLDSNQPVSLDWKNGAFVCGQFRGIKKEKEV